MQLKNFFGFIRRAWAGGIRGKVGILCVLFSLFVLVRMFFGDVSIQKFVFNIWKLHGEEKTLVSEQTKLGTMLLHIKLIQNYSPDFVEELGLKYLNIGDPAWKILKI